MSQLKHNVKSMIEGTKEMSGNVVEVIKQAPALTQEQMIKTLDQCYDKALNGVPGVSSSVEELVAHYQENSSQQETISNLVKSQQLKCATSGFITGFGGLLTLPAAIPAKVGSVLYIQIRMTAAIALIGGYDLQDPTIQTLIFTCLTGKSFKKILKGVPVKLKPLSQQTINLSDSDLSLVKTRIAIELIRRLTGKGLKKVTHNIPAVGGVMTGKDDYFDTSHIAKNAQKLFIESSK